jgi:hypothetical protein
MGLVIFFITDTMCVRSSGIDLLRVQKQDDSVSCPRHCLPANIPDTDAITRCEFKGHVELSQQ